LWPFQVVGSSDDWPEIMAHYEDEKRLFKPEQISSKVLAKMKEIVEIYLGGTVKNDVITVLVYFNDT
jgi:L1 cell adhesion molecule like protein